MEVRVKVRGVEAIITVKDATEAVALLNSLSSDAPSSTVVATVPSAAQVNDAAPLAVVDEDETDADEEAPVVVDTRSLRKTLRSLSGTEAGKILKAISATPNGCTDVQLRTLIQEQYGMSAEVNLGPLFSNISKACKRNGVPLNAVMTRMQKRIARGKVLYFYRITEAAKALIAALPRFDETPEFPGSEMFEQ